MNQQRNVDYSQWMFLKILQPLRELVSEHLCPLSSVGAATLAADGALHESFQG